MTRRASPTLAIARKELRSVFRERTFLVAVVIQIFVAGFSSFLAVGLSALTDPESAPATVEPVLAAYARNSTTARLYDRLAELGIALQPVDTDAEARRLFATGLVDGVLLVRQPSNDTVPITVELVLPDGELSSTFTLVRVKAALEKHESALRDAHQSRLDYQPISVRSAGSGGSFGFTMTVLLPILVILPVVLAGALLADSLTEEIQSGTLSVLLSSPATPRAVVEGKLLADATLAPALVGAWLLLLAANGVPISPGGAFLILLLAAALSILFGLLAGAIALATRDRNRAHVLYAVAFFLVLVVGQLLPTSLGNTVALLAAGSAHAGAYGVVGGTLVLAVGSWLVARWLLRRPASWMAAAG